MPESNLDRQAAALLRAIERQNRRIEGRIRNLNRSARAAVEAGRNPEDIEATLKLAYEAAQEQLAASFAGLIATLDNPPDEHADDEERERELPECVEEAIEEHPERAFDRSPAECPEGRAHRSPIFTDLESAIDYAEDVPSFWWLEPSTKKCRGWYVFICDETD